MRTIRAFQTIDGKIFTSEKKAKENAMNEFADMQNQDCEFSLVIIRSV